MEDFQHEIVKMQVNHTFIISTRDLESLFICKSQFFVISQTHTKMFELS